MKEETERYSIGIFLWNIQSDDLFNPKQNKINT